MRGRERGERNRGSKGKIAREKKGSESVRRKKNRELLREGGIQREAEIKRIKEQWERLIEGREICRGKDGERKKGREGMRERK